MQSVVIDENLPRSFGKVFEQNNFKVFDIRDHGLRGALDSAVFNFAKANQAAIATADLEFAHNIHSQPDSHRGVFLLRLPSKLSLSLRKKILDEAMQKIGNKLIENRIVVITPGTVRVHS